MCSGHNKKTIAMQLLKLCMLLAATAAAAASPPHAYPHHSNKVAALLAGAPRQMLNKAAHSAHSPAAHADTRPQRFYAAAAAAAAAAPSPLTVKPASMGGDPTGVNDSTAALQAAVDACVAQSVVSPNGVFPGSVGFPWGFGNGKDIRDMGGCVVDLEGGEYRISATIRIPQYTANMQMRTGSIVAGPDWSAAAGNSSFLVQVGLSPEESTECRHIPQASCNIDINFSEIFFDGGNVADALQVNNVMGVTVGPGGYFLNFTHYGVQINNGHECMIDRCWLGETNFDFDHQSAGVRPNATAIEINGNDHYVLNTIVFSAKVGLAVHGAADYITGTHVWFPLNQALAFADSAAFWVTKGGNRFAGCYADGGRVVFDGLGLAKNMWTNGFECCAGKGRTEAHGVILRNASLNHNRIGPGLQIFANEFGGGSVYYEDKQGTDITANLTVTGVRIHNNAFPNHATGTRVTRTQKQSAATAWHFDFCTELLFPQIASVRYDLVASAAQANKFVQAMASEPNGCQVTIHTSEAFSGEITVSVDSSEYDDLYI